MTNTIFTNIKSEIKFLLSGALPEENLNDYDIEVVGTTEKGDGFSGDIYFVNLTSIHRNHNFVMKCSKTSEALRETMPIRDIFEQEIYVYTTVFPTFRKFEIERNIREVFDSVPKCYGTFTGHGKEAIVLQNLKTLGHELWDKKLPLPRNYLETVLKLYGRWHAISAAIQDQKPEDFEKLTNSMIDTWAVFCNDSMCNAFVKAIEYVGQIWENDIEEHILNEWKQMKEHVEFYALNLRKKTKFFNVITHGDCWINNFMFKTTGDDEKSTDVKVAMLDWQFAGLTSPAFDVSYFLYSCISEEDLKDFDDLLKIYYRSFAEHLTKLGSNPDKIYTYSNLLDDWKIYGRLGIILAIMVFCVAFTEKDDILDLAELAENGEDIGDTFCKSVKSVDLIKQRSKCIIQHAVEREFFKPLKKLE